MENYENRQREVAGAITLAYAALAKVLGMLPIPIAVPPAIHPGWTGSDAADAITRAHDLVIDVPGIDDQTQQLILQMALDWLAAHTFGTLDYSQPAPWRLNQAQYALARFTAQLELVDERLGDTPEPEGGTE